MYTIVDKLSERQIDDLMELYKPEFWTGHRRREDVVRMLQNTDLIVGALDQNGRLVGFARILTDFVYRATLYDVIIAPRARGTGIGRRVLDAILNHPSIQQVESIDLSCKSEMIELYRKWGFTTDLNGTLFMRRRAQPR